MNEQLDGLWDAITNLEKRSRELERENDVLKQRVGDLEYKLSDLERSLTVHIAQDMTRDFRR